VPGQFAFARDNAFDLMLAGHTHGGQIRLPGLGALISPSWHGWHYASGVFHEPPTVMHVSRGISGKQPIRLNCPPEIAILMLTS
jgi:predicted MPP superfamily phosphohydrolase